MANDTDVVSVAVFLGALSICSYVFFLIIMYFQVTDVCKSFELSKHCLRFLMALEVSTL